ncbi:unnamed protein product, partial [Anisakis simplex]|uniref:Translation initiation factor if-2 n=1 Tax=Anisakis simplex TaxID=6269 RepID=A0A0M3JHR6_ANISI
KKPKPVANGNGTAVAAVKSAPAAAAAAAVVVKKLPPTGKKLPAPTRKPMKTIVEEGPSSKPTAATVKKSPRRSVRISSKADGDIANPANSAPSTSGSGSAAEPAPGSGGSSAAETVRHRSVVGHRRHTIGAGVDRKSAAAGPATKRYFLFLVSIFIDFDLFQRVFGYRILISVLSVSLSVVGRLINESLSVICVA